MNSIRDTLRKKEMQVTKLRREIEVLLAASRIMGAGRKGSGWGRHVPSQPEMIREVLLKHGAPLHADKILKAIEKNFKVRLKKADLTSVIYRAMRGKKFFRKAGNNTFGLVEWPVEPSNRNRK